MGFFWSKFIFIQTKNIYLFMLLYLINHINNFIQSFIFPKKTYLYFPSKFLSLT